MPKKEQKPKARKKAASSLADSTDAAAVAPPDTHEATSYQQQSEVMAIKRLLEQRHFRNAVAVGGGYGYLYSLLSQYADIITLVDAITEQKDAKKTKSEKAKSTMEPTYSWEYKDGSVDLLVMVRFLQQFQDPAEQLYEAARVLSPDGMAIIEVANYSQRGGLDRIRRYHRRGKAVEKSKNQNLPDPKQVIRQLAHAGLKVDRILSVASLQGSSLRKLMPGRVLLAVEGLLQPALGKRYHGPSVFFAVRKVQS
jgi:ubiquinone/menaquinone biosynthesis C-methylase UbiE